MIARRMFKIANSVGSEFAIDGSAGLRYESEAECKEAASKKCKEAGAADGYLIAFPIFVLEVPQEKGESAFFDLGTPVPVQRMNLNDIAR